jgi:hypothetical protein
MRIVFPVLTVLPLMASVAFADTPNLQPGLWAYTHITTIEGAVSLPPQSSKNQECLQQQDLDKGVDMLNIPEQCTLTRVDIKRDRADFAASCDIGGMTSSYEGHTDFNGDTLEGQMQSETDTPLGKMLMNMTFNAKRVGDC